MMKNKKITVFAIVTIGLLLGLWLLLARLSNRKPESMIAQLPSPPTGILEVVLDNYIKAFFLNKKGYYVNIGTATWTDTSAVLMISTSDFSLDHLRILENRCQTLYQGINIYANINDTALLSLSPHLGFQKIPDEVFLGAAPIAEEPLDYLEVVYSEKRHCIISVEKDHKRAKEFEQKLANQGLLCRNGRY